MNYSVWQTDANGQRFRWDGKIKEYMPTIRTTAGTLTAEQLAAYNAQQHQQTTQEQATGRVCPIKNGIDCACIAACALFDGGCRIARRKAKYGTDGRKCPVQPSQNCRVDCGFFNGGCGLTNLF